MSWLRKFFLENVGLKLLSLALAVALWAALGSDPVTEVLFQVPVEFRNVPRDLEVLSGETSVQLRARGPSRLVRQAAPGDFSVQIDLSPVTGPGERTFPLDPASVETPPSVEVVRMLPAEVTLTIRAIPQQ